MDRQERSYANMEATDSVETKQSKQRASIKWLLSKAYNNRVPDNLVEPFYRDHEDQEHLKPPIVGRLASAELYCLALANMYSDPNYHSLNHWNILNTLARKGVHVAAPQDATLTETVLIQTNPLKMSAHMAVVEALMVLYAREVVTPDRVSAAAQRFGVPVPALAGGGGATSHEDGLLCWINAACTALNRAEEGEATLAQVGAVSTLQDVCDGAALAALVSFYCPECVPRSAVRVGRAASLHDCLHNLVLVRRFCRDYLPHDVFHMMPEDVTYMRGSMRQNLIAMLADLFNMLEVHPVNCVKYPSSARADSNEHGVRHKRCLPPPPPVPIPHLRPDDVACGAFTVPRSPSACGMRARGPRSACSTPERRSCSPQREEFVVHRGRAVTTLSSLARRDDDNVSASPDGAAATAAGRPSNWGGAREASFAGRRSRRSSITDDSQLTVENFGGSQDRLHFAGRNPEKELATVASVRKVSAPAGPLDYNPPLRSSRQDIRGSIQFFHGDYQNGSSQDERSQKLERQNSQPAQAQTELRVEAGGGGGGGDAGFYLNRDAPDGEIAAKMNFADMNKPRSNGDQAGIQMYKQESETASEPRRKTSFSTPPPNTTTWQQHYLQQPQHNGSGDQLGPETGTDESAALAGHATAAQLNNIRLKLEEKRRRMEHDKRRMEVALDRQRQQLGQQAFLQAVTRGKPRSPHEPAPASPVPAPAQHQEVPPEVISHNMPERRTPDIDTVAMEQYHHSIAKMNSNIQDIQSDIARLASQQTQLQQHAAPPAYLPPPQPSPSTPYAPYQPNIPQLVHQQNHQYQQPIHEPQQQRNWKSPSPQPPQVQDTRTWNPQGFVLHDRTNQQPFPVHYNTPDRYQNGTENSRESQNHLSYTVINRPQSPPEPCSPRRARTPQRQASVPVSLQQLRSPTDMEPQNISFIGNAEDDALRQGIDRLNISSGTRTYRIPSPTRPSLNRNSFQQLHEADGETNEPVEKGFYISFDNDQPKRPKPPLRAKKGSPKKDRTPSENPSPERKNSTEMSPWNERLPEPEEEAFVVHRVGQQESTFRSNDASLNPRETSPREKSNLRPTNAEPAALVIGELNPDPNCAEEMERKKERIMLLSLQRRQRAEEARARGEAAAAARRAREEAAAEVRAARRDQQARRRGQILHQYKMKKAREEAEREGKTLDKTEYMETLRAQPAAGATTGGTRMRSKQTPRARPKTIHVDSGALHAATAAAEGALGAKQPSSTNLTAGSMRRDYYRGSQDSLAERAGLYRESPVEDRGAMSPSSGSGSGPLGRRGSCKTSRERVNEQGLDQAAPRGRSKFSTYQNNFKTGRKSSSLMNLCDSGLGRATPPRRAASPGVRTLGSPGAGSGCGSGPGSLPGGIGKRRHERQDDASDVSSTHSSIMDYSGPRLYKQPTTKSNRGIMLNAVEYCVFPGAVNAEAKRRVLEEVARSESKHFLVLFRDAGCQFRALYSYCPDADSVAKLYGTGPRNVNERMYDKFFKYNSGSKCFSQVHTKHLTVTIDAFTIHNSLWQGKKVQLPSKKDMALVI